MSKLKVPSLQHLARIWRPEPEAVCRQLIELSLQGPIFSYAPLHEIVRDMLLFKLPYEQALTSVNRIPRANVRDIYLSLLPLIHQHFSTIEVDYVQDVVPRLYAIDRDLFIPFRPTMVYGKDEQLHLPWLSLWKRNPTSKDGLSLFATIAAEVLRQDPDLERASFRILDFSAPPKGDDRCLVITDINEIPAVSSKQAMEMLAIFAEGFRMAKLELAGRPLQVDDDRRDTIDPSQRKLI